MFHITQETAADWWEVEALYDLCFAPGRTALSSYRLRDNIDPVPELSLAARDPDQILAGAIRHWPVRIGTDYALLLGPVAVHPTRQGEGLGGLLIRESIEIASAIGGESKLARQLISDFSWGHISGAAVQKTAANALADG